eukprot:TRINITY_DN4605_c0_g2_i1.p1 TRINITY_DN4605_c0_g2~~TRINITY_DN4605_c0_g2_i1.p1  ORF type:complete len:692 (+),score=130.00 TRINITY_DN4605_c0_g2_i1:146-2221(+)
MNIKFEVRLFIVLAVALLVCEASIHRASVETPSSDQISDGTGGILSPLRTSHKLIISPWTEYTINTFSSNATSRTVQIMYETTNGDTYWCSGALIDSQWVLTSAQCLFDTTLQTQNVLASYRIIPGATQNLVFPQSFPKYPFGVARAQQIFIPNFAIVSTQTTVNDYGFIMLDRPIGARTGFFAPPEVTTMETLSTFDMYGYPQGPYQGRLQLKRGGNVVSASALATVATGAVTATVQTVCSGDSGAPAVNGNQLLGLLSTSPIISGTCGANPSLKVMGSAEWSAFAQYKANNAAPSVARPDVYEYVVPISRLTKSVSCTKIGGGLGGSNCPKNSRLNFAFPLINLGDAESGVITYRIVYSGLQTLAEPVVISTGQTTASLLPGEIRNITANYTLPAANIDGTFYYGIVFTTANEQYARDEALNTIVLGSFVFNTPTTPHTVVAQIFPTSCGFMTVNNYTLYNGNSINNPILVAGPMSFSGCVGYTLVAVTCKGSVSCSSWTSFTKVPASASGSINATFVASPQCGNGVVEVGEQCDGGPCCTSSCLFTQSDYICRTSSGVCEQDSYCRGNAISCPANAYRAAGESCSPGACAMDSTCSGSGIECPFNGFAPVDRECRAVSGVCDLAEKCTGTAVACPLDVYRPEGTLCNGTASMCNALGTCLAINGASAVTALPVLVITLFSVLFALFAV